MKKEKTAAIGRLIEILDRLRTECPWDRKQTNETLRNMTLEECYELADAIDNHDNDNIKEELGDVLLHVLFYAKIAEEQGLYTIEDVAEGECEKLIFRHPHIFSDTKVTGAEDVVKNWEQLKKLEKNRQYTLSGVPGALPAIMKAEKIQKKAAKTGFDWQDRNDVWEKVTEEMAEVRAAIDNESQQRIEEEFGDLLFSVINAARLYKVDPESALEKCNRKFIARFTEMERQAETEQKTLEGMTLDELETRWQQAKTVCKNHSDHSTKN